VSRARLLWSALLVAGLAGRASSAREPAPPATTAATSTSLADIDRSWLTAKALRAERTALPAASERLALGELYRELLQAAPSGRVPAEARSLAGDLGLRLHREGPVLWLRERGDPLRGLGLVAVRLGPLPAEVVVEAPHPFHDSDTGAIVGRLFDDAARTDTAGPDSAEDDAPPTPAVRAVFIATAERDALDGGDPTDATTHPLQVFTDAVARALVRPLVVQIHGFSPRTTPADAVVSVGRSQSGGDLELRAREALATTLHVPDVRGPDEVPRLAAGTNVQGRLLAERARFLHLELDAAQRRILRTRLRSRGDLRVMLADLAAGGTP